MKFPHLHDLLHPHSHKTEETKEEARIEPLATGETDPALREILARYDERRQQPKELLETREEAIRKSPLARRGRASSGLRAKDAGQKAASVRPRPVSSNNGNRASTEDSNSAADGLGDMLNTPTTNWTEMVSTAPPADNNITDPGFPGFGGGDSDGGGATGRW